MLGGKSKKSTSPPKLGTRREQERDSSSKPRVLSPQLGSAAWSLVGETECRTETLIQCEENGKGDGKEDDGIRGGKFRALWRLEAGLPKGLDPLHQNRYEANGC